jgi:hypothetical protein
MSGCLFELRHQFAIRFFGRLRGENLDFGGVDHACEHQPADGAKHNNLIPHRPPPPVTACSIHPTALCDGAAFVARRSGG